jgi:hypothetical protein
VADLALRARQNQEPSGSFFVPVLGTGVSSCRTGLDRTGGPCPSARFTGTELAERISWSEIDPRGLGTLVTMLIALPWAVTSIF